MLSKQISVTKLIEQKSASMYESDDEYSFVVLSRVNSLKKVRWKIYFSANCGVVLWENPKKHENQVKNLSVVSMKTFCYIKIYLEQLLKLKSQ